MKVSCAILLAPLLYGDDFVQAGAVLRAQHRSSPAPKVAVVSNSATTARTPTSTSTSSLSTASSSSQPSNTNGAFAPLPPPPPPPQNSASSTSTSSVQTPNAVSTTTNISASSAASTISSSPSIVQTSSGVSSTTSVFTTSTASTTSSSTPAVTSTSLASSTTSSPSSTKPSTTTSSSSSSASSKIPSTTTTSSSVASTSMVTSTTSNSMSSKSLSSSTTLTTTSTSTSTRITSASTSSTSAACTGSVRGNGKRGLGYNDPQYTNPYSLCGTNSKISWTVNWASDPYYPYNWGSSVYNTAFTYVPMLWSGASDLTSIWGGNIKNAKAKYGADSLLAFNEPDGCDNGGSCMNVSSAVTAYQAYIQPYAGQFALGAPAVTNGQGSGVGLDWLRQFVAACNGCTFDFIPIHFYGDVTQVSQFTSYVQNVYSIYNKPIWVTEFGPTSGTPAQVQQWLSAAMAWLDSQSYVKRYAYFMDAPNGDNTWLIGSNGSMNALGQMYNS